MFDFLEFDEKLSNLSFLEDKNLDHGPVFWEFLVDELVGHLEGHSVVNTD